VLVRHEEYTAGLALACKRAVIQRHVELAQALADTIAEPENRVKGRPVGFLDRYLGVVLSDQLDHSTARKTISNTYVNLSGIIDVRIDTPLKDLFELLRFRVLALGQAGQVDIEESGTAHQLTLSL
jgi:hypothetical protein